MLAPVVTIFTENPNAEQWRMLSQFTYATNVSRLIPSSNSPLIEFIVACIRQAEAYFLAARNAALDISPVLYYYGASNLLAACWGIVRRANPEIQEHGMNLQDVTAEQRLRNLKIITGGAERTAFYHFWHLFSGDRNPPGKTDWSLGEVLGSIPDLKDSFDLCYPEVLRYSLTVDVVRRPLLMHDPQSVMIDRIQIQEFAKFEGQSNNPLERVVGLTDAYVDIQRTKSHLILFRKYRAQEIGDRTVWGKKYFPLAHQKQKNGFVLSQVIAMYMGLYALATLSRYHPQVWNPFLRVDPSGERLLIERFLSLCDRGLPNLVINKIWRKQIVFTNEIAKA